MPDAWKTGSVTGLKARGGFTFDISWENGKVNHIKVLSDLGGNLRLKVKNEIEGPDVIDLNIADGPNPNPLFAINEIKEPLVSDQSNIQIPEFPVTYTYDIQTDKGAVYEFDLKH